MPEYTMTYTMVFVLIGRIVLSAICGMLIGWEREKRLKSAGLRTG